ncbi:MAG: hypothetical protein PHU62_08140 [Bacteroidales bacterium]|jgi:hypothetical protein|nr:hypothetical protein [Bacteroidales bacterium]MDD2204376.1 hypothetical protein [Bacteroidales bacterium]MDD3152437.1 hypothetical protein [Bacteroidales bacterium]MDD3913852.1 hypothetical protein [Bacteroidales bacterium]MDD4634523.1 hypothetical protein [Bacteroidales bacterium]
MKNKLIISSIIIILLGIIGFAWLKYFMPQFYFALYPVIPALTLIVMLASNLILINIYNKKHEVNFKLYWLIRGIKFIIFLVFALLYIKLVAINNIAFVVVFMLFYFICLTLESWLFIQMTKEK